MRAKNTPVVAQMEMPAMSSTHEHLRRNFAHREVGMRVNWRRMRDDATKAGAAVAKVVTMTVICVHEMPKEMAPLSRAETPLDKGEGWPTADDETFTEAAASVMALANSVAFGKNKNASGKVASCNSCKDAAASRKEGPAVLEAAEAETSRATRSSSNFCPTAYKLPYEIMA